MLQIPVSVETFDKFIAFLTYALTSLTVLLTIIILMLTVLAIRGPLVENTEAKRQELRQKRFENMLTLMSVISDQKNGAFIQLASLTTLGEYPEYIDVYEYILKHYINDPEKDTYDNAQFIAAAKKLIASSSKAK
jgi:hypothetical protein